MGQRDDIKSLLYSGSFFFLLLALSSWEMLAVSLIGSAITFFVFFFRDFFFFSFLDTQGLDDVLSPVCNGKHGAML